MRRARFPAPDGWAPAAAIAVAAGMLACAAPPPALAGMAERIAVRVMPYAGANENAWIGERTRQLIIARLAAHGYAVHDVSGTRTVQPASAARQGVVLEVETTLRLIDGTYSRRATLALGARLLDGATRRHLAWLETPPGPAWRLPAGCARTCLDRHAFRRAEPLAVDLAARIAHSLSRLARSGLVPAGGARTIAFRGLDADPALARRIEGYLRVFPGLAEVRRIAGSGRDIVFRYRLTGDADTTETSLRQMIRHFGLDGQVKRNGDALVVVGTAARDW